MANVKVEWVDTLIHLFALASRLEEEGQYNLAKLARAAADSLCRQAAYPPGLPTDSDRLVADIQQTIAALSRLNVSADLLSAWQRGTELMAQGELSLITVTPHPYVCRTCGQITLSPPAAPCPTCGAWGETFQKFMPNYWFDALEPPAAMQRLRQTPTEVEKLLEGLSDAQLDWQPPDKGWAIRNILTHA